MISFLKTVSPPDNKNHARNFLLKKIFEQGSVLLDPKHHYRNRVAMLEHLRERTMKKEILHSGPFSEHFLGNHFNNVLAEEREVC